MSTLDQATPIVFPGFDPRHLPASFRDLVRLVDGIYMARYLTALFGDTEF